MPKITTVPKIRIITLPKINSSHLKIGHSKRKLVFKPSIFRCENVSFREGNAPKEWMSWICFCWCFVYLFYRGKSSPMKKAQQHLGEYVVSLFPSKHQSWRCSKSKDVFSTLEKWRWLNLVQLGGETSIFGLFSPLFGEMIPFWLVFFKGVFETTNYTRPRFIYIHGWK